MSHRNDKLLGLLEAAVALVTQHRRLFLLRLAELLILPPSHVRCRGLPLYKLRLCRIAGPSLAVQQPTQLTAKTAVELQLGLLEAEQ